MFVCGRLWIEILGTFLGCLVLLITCISKVLCVRARAHAIFWRNICHCQGPTALQSLAASWEGALESFARGNELNAMKSKRFVARFCRRARQTWNQDSPRFGWSDWTCRSWQNGDSSAVQRGIWWSNLVSHLQSRLLICSGTSKLLTRTRESMSAKFWTSGVSA